MYEQINIEIIINNYFDKPLLIHIYARSSSNTLIQGWKVEDMYVIHTNPSNHN